eukprot:15353053-Ditylum_brightwellii.AAC.1
MAMVHPHNQILDGVDNSNIGCLIPHDISAGMEETMMLHGVDDGVNDVRRMKQNACCECQDHGVPNVTKSRHLLSDSAKLNDGKEVGDCVDNCVNNCVDDHIDDCVDDCVGNCANGSVDDSVVDGVIDYIDVSVD